MAEQAGYNLIGEVNDVIPEILFAALVANRSWLEANSATVGKLLEALTNAYVITNDPSMEEITLPIFQRITVPDDAVLARRGLRYMRDMGMWPHGLAIPDKALDTTIDLMIRAGLLDEANRTSATGVFDHSYLQRGMSR